MENISMITETVFQFIGIIIFIKGFLDWYIDYRIDIREKRQQKNHRYSRKDKR